MADNQRIEDLRRRVQKDPTSIAFAQLAEELRRTNAFEESIETCRAGLAIHPGYLSARVTLGRALLEVHALEDAQAELETVLKSAPENLAAIRGLAEIFQRRGQLPEALAQFRAALALAKNDPDLQQTIAELAKVVEPQRPAHVTEGLSFEQMRDELFAAVPPATPAAAPSNTADAASERTDDTLQGPEDSEHAVTNSETPQITADLTGGAAAGPFESTLPDPTTTIADPASATHAPPGTIQRPATTIEDRPSAECEPAAASVAAPVESNEPVERDRADRTIVALEQWLDAIHVTRTQSRS